MSKKRKKPPAASEPAAEPAPVLHGEEKGLPDPYVATEVLQRINAAFVQANKRFMAARTLPDGSVITPSTIVSLCEDVSEAEGEAGPFPSTADAVDGLLAAGMTQKDITDLRLASAEHSTAVAEWAGALLEHLGPEELLKYLSAKRHTATVEVKLSVEFVGGSYEKVAAGEVSAFLDLGRVGRGILSMQPAQTIDRAARGPAGWLLAPDRLPRFDDPRSPLFVEYQRDGATAEALAEGVNRLNPRTADVWRLMTARSLEAWQVGQDAPPAVWFDLREIAAAMGYKKHHNGGYKPEHLAEVARAVHDLDAFHITLPLGTQIYQPAKAGSKRRAPAKLEAVRTYKVLHISARDEVRNLFGERHELRYKLRPGEWIDLYPRTYAPLFKALVELPARAGANTWAKTIGTELLFQYRQNAKNSTAVEKLKVRTLLERAVLLEEASASRNKGRMRTYFEEALGILEIEQVCAGWEYAPEDSDRLEAVSGTRGWFAVWLECRVLITIPDGIINELQATSDTAKKAQRAQQRRRLSDTR